jgi:hypothetical protein
MNGAWSIIVTMLIALLAVAIAYRVNFLHKLVFGKGSAHINKCAERSVETVKVVS